MKIYSLLIGCIFLFTGCISEKECPEPIIQYKTIETKVAVKPDRPKIDCDFNQPNVENAMLDCIILQKKVIESLTKEPNKI